MSVLDRWMPRFDVNEVHSTRVHAPLDRVDAAVRALDAQSSWIIRTLFLLRSLGSRNGLGADRAGLLRSGFAVLEEEPGRHLVLGLTGRFWQLNGGIRRLPTNAFRDFAEPGFALVGWSFELVPDGPEVAVTTETRVHCTDDESRRKFRRYWRLIGPFSALIRREMLRAIRTRAENVAVLPSQR